MIAYKIEPGEGLQVIEISWPDSLRTVLGGEYASLTLDNGLVVVVRKYDETQDSAPSVWMHAQPFDQPLYGPVVICRSGIDGPISVREDDNDYIYEHFKAVRDYD